METVANKTILFLAVILMLAAPVFAQTGASIKTVVIDPGHGGKDPGAVGKNSKEKDIALSIALKLGEYITSKCQGIKVVYTRKKDVFVPLAKRAEIANSANADMFISVHINSSTNKEAYGTSSHVYGFCFNLDMKTLSLQENNAVKFEENYLDEYGDWETVSEIKTMSSFTSSPLANQGKQLAEKIQNEFETRAKRYNRGVEYASFLVLKRTQMPAVLVECGFISNEEEEKFMASTYGQEILASAIFRAFRDYNGSSSQPEPTKSNICFRIQLKSLSKQIPLNSSELKGIPNIEELHINGKYQYVVGKETDYKKITDQLANIRKQIPDAFVIAVRNGTEKVDIKVAKKELGQ